MYYIHDELMHAINRSLAKHRGHRFEEAEINVLKDIAFDIVYILDPKNVPARGLMRRGLVEFRAMSILSKIGTIAAVLVFLGTFISGAIELTKNSVELWKMIRGPAEPIEQPAPPKTRAVKYRAEYTTSPVW